MTLLTFPQLSVGAIIRAVHVSPFDSGQWIGKRIGNCRRLPRRRGGLGLTAGTARRPTRSRSTAWCNGSTPVYGLVPGLLRGHLCIDGSRWLSASSVIAIEEWQRRTTFGCNPRHHHRVRGVPQCGGLRMPVATNSGPVAASRPRSTCQERPRLLGVPARDLHLVPPRLDHRLARVCGRRTSHWTESCNVRRSIRCVVRTVAGRQRFVAPPLRHVQRHGVARPDVGRRQRGERDRADVQRRRWRTACRRPLGRRPRGRRRLLESVRL